ncbi:MAG TPA: hypothetical protein PLU37_03035 [Chitinophagaceae bacterium]|nr:hypothetical protein [Chitinophagaceae bacterium]MCB9055253.1 hypothetical protein [Chitinophagales bacterium]HPG10477.1 hypothetical protein [Chitinophagaceae bacterium]HRX92939.1 hypothetical protein [Chitinophagaceae bacterium]
MKKRFLILSTALTLVVGSAFAGNVTDVTQKVKDSFKKSFANAQVLEWNEAGDFLKVTFLTNGVRAEAYFTDEGELAGSIRSVFADQLPLSVVSAVNTKYGEPVLMEIFEISNVEGTKYRITLESSDNKYQVTSDASGNIVSSEKLKK